MALQRLWNILPEAADLIECTFKYGACNAMDAAIVFYAEEIKHNQIKAINEMYLDNKEKGRVTYGS